MLWHLEALLTLESSPFPGLADSYRQYPGAPEHALHVQTNQSRAHTHSKRLYLALTLRPLATCPNSPGPGIGQLGRVLTPWSPLKSSNPKVLASRAPSHRKHDEGLCPCVAPAPSVSMVWPPWCDVPIPLGKCNKQSIQWWSRPDMLASPYPNNNKTYILQQCF